MIHKTAFMNINEHIEYIKRTTQHIPEDKKQNTQITLTSLEKIKEKGKKLLNKDQKILDILYTLATNAAEQDKAEHMFLINQFMSFYTPEKFTKLTMFQLKKDTINTFNSNEGIEILSYIREKINFIIRHGDINEDPRTNPIQLYISCITINKYINGPRLVF